MGRQRQVKSLRRILQSIAHSAPDLKQHATVCELAATKMGFRPRIGRRIAALSAHGFEARERSRLGHIAG